MSVTAPAASCSVAFSCQRPLTLERALLIEPEMLPSKSVVVPSALRCVVGPKLKENLRFLTVSRA